MTVSTYDDIAEWYDNWVGAHALREALMGEVAGREGCRRFAFAVGYQ